MTGHVLDYVNQSSNRIYMRCEPCNWSLDITGKTGDWLAYYWHIHRLGTEITKPQPLAKAANS